MDKYGYGGLYDRYEHCNGNCPTSQFIPPPVKPEHGDVSRRVKGARIDYLGEIRRSHRKLCPLRHIADQERELNDADMRRDKEDLLRRAANGQYDDQRYDTHLPLHKLQPPERLT